MRASIPPRRVPLRVRATLAFGIAAVVLATTLATVAYVLVRRSLIDEREDAAERQAYLNARLIRSRLRVDAAPAEDLLSGLHASGGGRTAVRWRGQWFVSSVDLEPSALPRRLVAEIEAGRSARQIVNLAGSPFAVVGVPVREVDAWYFDVVPLADIDRALSSLAWSLVGAGTAGALIAAAVGAAAARAVLRPVARTADAAREIVAGDLTARLAADGDPDLEPLAESFNAVVDALRERILREARFASDVTHELRGPLAALESAVHVVNRRRADLPETVVSAVDALAAQVDSFKGLVVDLLEISRFDAAAARLEPRRLDVSAFVRHVLDEHGFADVPVHVRSGAPREILVDPRRLHQIVVNLVRNAQQYAGGPHAVEISQSERGVAIAVEDRGPGVKESEREVIFTRFARGAAADATDAPSGTGLGLALVAAHVQLHGGRVWVEDAHPSGARFVVELPETVA